MKNKQINVAFIPARGGSKSIPLKNIMPICGKPLIYWAIDAAANCKYIDMVYISTDSDDIKNCVLKHGSPKVKVIPRSPETTTDTATTESSMTEFCNNYEFDNIVLIQATSPLITTEDLNRGFEKLSSDYDSVLSAVKQKRFIWDIENGEAIPKNYDFNKRPLRQFFDGYYVENGAFYIISKENYLKNNCRLYGKIGIVEMDDKTYFEIDEPSDWEIIETFLDRINRKKELPDLSNIKLVATDCDGVLTDAGMYYSESGDELKKFNTLDGMGFQLLRENNIKTAIITSENNSLVSRRSEKLKVDFCVLGCKDKLNALKDICEELKITLDECAYIGDDIYDASVILNCGFGCAPGSSNEYIAANAKYITKKKGGEGCFRELADLILKR